MMSTDEAKRIADGWVREYSRSAHAALAVRERTFFFELDDLVYHHPNDALLVFERMAGLALADWEFEGVAGGPIRTFLHLYGDQYENDMEQIGRRAPLFVQLRALALNGE